MKEISMSAVRSRLAALTPCRVAPAILIPCFGNCPSRRKNQCSARDRTRGVRQVARRANPAHGDHMPLSRIFPLFGHDAGLRGAIASLSSAPSALGRFRAILNTAYYSCNSEPNAEPNWWPPVSSAGHDWRTCRTFPIKDSTENGFERYAMSTSPNSRPIISRSA